MLNEALLTLQLLNLGSFFELSPHQLLNGWG
jgi:hypothetical protein